MLMFSALIFQIRLVSRAQRRHAFREVSPPHLIHYGCWTVSLVLSLSPCFNPVLNACPYCEARDLFQFQTLRGSVVFTLCYLVGCHKKPHHACKHDGILSPTRFYNTECTPKSVQILCRYQTCKGGNVTPNSAHHSQCRFLPYRFRWAGVFNL